MCIFLICQQILFNFIRHLLPCTTFISIFLRSIASANMEAAQNMYVLSRLRQPRMQKLVKRKPRNFCWRSTLSRLTDWNTCFARPMPSLSIRARSRTMFGCDYSAAHLVTLSINIVTFISHLVCYNVTHAIINAVWKRVQLPWFHL